MIKIVKDNTIKVVTKGAFDSFYAPLGYTMMNENKPVEKSDKKEISDEVKSEKKVNDNNKVSSKEYSKRK